MIAYLHQPLVQLACNLYGYVPSVQVTWYQENGTEIQNSSKYSISLHSQHGNRHMVQIGGVAPQPSTLSILSIHTTLQSDSGTYTCAVHNSTAEITLIVQLPPGTWLHTDLYIPVTILYSLITYSGKNV